VSQVGDLVNGFGGDVNGRFVSCVALPAMTSSVATARLHTRTLMEKWEVPAVVDDAEVVVSEILTNAIKATTSLPGDAGPPSDRPEHVCLCLFLDDGELVVEVWDPRYETPERRDVDLYDEGGRGLWLVESLSRDWGVRWPATGGKIVWARLPCPAPAPAADAAHDHPPTRLGAST
jgi:anti-sigma regulatory factor (Ser/Thr protein kinase)